MSYATRPRAPAKKAARFRVYFGGMKLYDAAIIGGGHNGLTAAAYLARAGLSVVVLERREILGGAAVSEPTWPGYQISTGSYVCSLLDPEVIEDLELQSHGYDAYIKDPWSFTPLLDGRSLMLGRDGASNEREIAAFSAQDVHGFHRFEELAASLGSRLFETFSDADPNFQTFDAKTQQQLCGSVADLVEHFVQTPVLAAMLANDGLVGTYAGPRDAGTAYVMAHHYAGRALGTQGAWGFVRGGMGSISRALASSARQAGARITESASVQQIGVRGGRAHSVILSDGSELEARTILSNAHPQTTFLELVPAGVFRADFLDRVHSWKTTGPSLKLNLALGELPNFAARPGTHLQEHHRASIHVAPSIDYLQTAYEDARTGSVSRAPMLECFMQTPTDASLAPRGKHILSIFAQYYPYDRADEPWTEGARAAVADSIINTLAQFAPNIPNVIEERQLLAPPDLQARFGLRGGHIFHGELLPGQIYERRFASRTPLHGLYLCGSGAHPGGCVSGFPGKRAARAVLHDLKTASVAMPA